MKTGCRIKVVLTAMLMMLGGGGWVMGTAKKPLLVRQLSTRETTIAVGNKYSDQNREGTIRADPAAGVGARTVSRSSTPLSRTTSKSFAAAASRLPRSSSVLGVRPKSTAPTSSRPDFMEPLSFNKPQKGSDEQPVGGAALPAPAAARQKPLASILRESDSVIQEVDDENKQPLPVGGKNLRPDAQDDSGIIKPEAFPPLTRPKTAASLTTRSNNLRTTAKVVGKFSQSAKQAAIGRVDSSRGALDQAKMTLSSKEKDINLEDYKDQLDYHIKQLASLLKRFDLSDDEQKKYVAEKQNTEKEMAKIQQEKDKIGEPTANDQQQQNDQAVADQRKTAEEQLKEKLEKEALEARQQASHESALQRLTDNQKSSFRDHGADNDPNSSENQDQPDDKNASWVSRHKTGLTVGGLSLGGLGATLITLGATGQLGGSDEDSEGKDENQIDPNSTDPTKIK